MSGEANSEKAAPTPRRFDSSPLRLIVYHTADLHNRLPPAAARQLAQLKRAGRGALLLDGGDAVKAGNLGFSPRGEPVLRAMAEAGYDAMAMGNRESHPNCFALEQKLKDAAFPVLSANLVARVRLPAMVKPHIFLEGAGLRVAVFGVTPQMTRPDSVWAKVTDFVWEEPVETARRVAPELKRQADLVVCLSHCGLRADRIVAGIPEIDLLLGAHSHRDCIEHSPGGAMLVHPGKFGQHVSHIELASREEVWAELMPLETGP